MPRVSYVNGAYVPHGEAMVHIEDRGYQFADGIYEVFVWVHGTFLDLEGHLERLEFSAKELGIELPLSLEVLGHTLNEMVRLNRLRKGYIYIQVTRGVAPRLHRFPENPVSSLVIVAKRFDLNLDYRTLEGVRVVSTPDIRWRQVYIKSTALLPNVLAKEFARNSGAFEAWLVDDKGYVTEGGSSNAWMINKKGEILTRPIDGRILSGITRARILTLCKEAGLKVREEAFTLEEALLASEAFLSSATSFVLPITQINNKVLGDGKPGPLTLEIAKLYGKYIQKERRA